MTVAIRSNCKYLVIDKVRVFDHIACLLFFSMYHKQRSKGGVSVVLGRSCTTLLIRRKLHIHSIAWLRTNVLCRMRIVSFVGGSFFDRLTTARGSNCGLVLPRYYN